MKLHGNARLTPQGRALMCRRVREEGWTVAEAAEAAGCSERTCYRWLVRFDSGDSLEDRSSAPARVANRTRPSVCALIEDLRLLGQTSTRIAAELGMATSTVCAVLVRLGLNKLWKLVPPEPTNRYCRRHPGELIHIDIKKLGRFNRPGHRVLGRGPGRDTPNAGWDHIHVAIDDTTRIAYAEALADETAPTAIGFLARAVAWFADHGITVQRVITDNGSAYRSRDWQKWCVTHGIKPKRTRPYRPQTNGKAERFIQTLQREWAYGVAYPSSAARNQALEPWLTYYNRKRPHSALSHKPPASLLG